jgi:hypothetical protein
MTRYIYSAILNDYTFKKGEQLMKFCVKSVAWLVFTAITVMLLGTAVFAELNPVSGTNGESVNTTADDGTVTAGGNSNGAVTTGNTGTATSGTTNGNAVTTPSGTNAPGTTGGTGGTTNPGGTNAPGGTNPVGSDTGIGGNGADDGGTNWVAWIIGAIVIAVVAVIIGVILTSSRRRD